MREIFSGDHNIGYHRQGFGAAPISPPGRLPVLPVPGGPPGISLQLPPALPLPDPSAATQSLVYAPRPLLPTQSLRAQVPLL